jgi:hypothetical protein
MIEVYEHKIPAIVKTVCLFLGRKNLDRRIETAERMLSAAAGPLYRENFVRPRQSLWIGTRDILKSLREGSFSLKSATPTVVAALHHLASIHNVLHTMPSWKKNEFRTRLMDKSGGDIPALIEIATASRIVTHGGTIKWVAEQGAGERIFDLLVSFKGEKLEVECKAKIVDAGRKLARGAIYQFGDKIRSSGLFRGLTPRFITITMDGRFPVDQHRQRDLLDTIEAFAGNGGTKNVKDGTIVVEKIPEEELKTRARNELREFEHRLVGSKLVVSFQSRKPDEMISNIETDLRDALRQFSGDRPAAIVCYVPEIGSFAGTEKNGTATFALVRRFLTRPDAGNIVSLTFMSDPTIDFRSNEIATEIPCVRFVANKFRESRLSIF